MRRNNLSVAVIGLILSVAIAFGGMTAVAKPPALEQPTETLTNESWTVMVYLCGDNNLESYALMDLDEMELVGSQNDVTVIVYMDLTDALITGTHWYVVEDATEGIVDHINAETGDFTCDCEEVTGVQCEDGSGDEADMGAGTTLTDFIVQCVDYAPADRYMLILWDHGGGWRGVCYDDSHWVVDEELGWVSRLTVPETADAIEVAETRILANKELDEDYRLTMIGYDACLMGMIEVVYENRNLADYMFASITLVSVLGQDYERILQNVTKVPRMTPDEIGIAIVDSFANFYEDYVPTGKGIEGWGDQSMTLFRLDTEDDQPVQDLVDKVNVLSHELYNEYLDDFSYRGALESAESQTPKIPSNSGEQLPFVDLGLYAEKLGEKIPILEPLTTPVVNGVNKVVVWENHVTSEGGAIMRTSGMTVYFTCCYHYINPAYQYETELEAQDGDNTVYYGLQFVIDTWWDEFVFTYTQALDETLYIPKDLPQT